MVVGQSVAVAAKPFGISVFKPFARVTTVSGGAYTASSKPKKQTVYQASASGVTVLPAVTVKVSQRLTLSVRRSGGKVYFKGTLGPNKRRRIVVIQVRAGKRWKVLARVRTSRRSTFKGARPLAPGHAYSFRAKTGKYPGLLGGTSRTVRLRR